MARQTRSSADISTVCNWITKQSLQRSYTPIGLDADDAPYYIDFWSMIQTLQHMLCKEQAKGQRFDQCDIAPYLSLLLNKVCLTLTNCSWNKKTYELCARVWIHPACRQILSTKWLTDGDRCTWLKQLSLPWAQHKLLKYKATPIWLHGICFSDNPKPKLTAVNKEMGIPQHDQGAASTQYITCGSVKKFLTCYGCFILHPKARAALKKCTIQSPQRIANRSVATSSILPVIRNPISDGANQQQPLLSTQYDD